ncbi:hypothetical protein H0H92_001834 [Tricholoma furcatifolium]|nr:hypothetical protein H0H92_001834 [Tricholoma furcatifolium]
MNAFDHIPFDDIKGSWKKLGAGSFGNVYKGVYLGIDVAIKEVLPSKEYDVAKYFEREWRLMKECRHPNICLFIGLSRAPDPDGRIFIVSEFIDNGNLRLFIHDKSKPFPWRLRISFATDAARALAYLHARKCIHRDLKGENLLVTSNGRLKITDFGFARIAARNAEESKRLTFCGTDSYMSPEILLGEEFDLPIDIFSLGIIFCEIAARKLADDTHFKRHPPTFGIDVEEVQRLADHDCPKDFLVLCIDCLNIDPSKRPTTREILERLRAIEAQVHARPNDGEDAHVGSIKFLTGGKRSAAGPRIPSFGLGIGKDIRHNGSSASDDNEEDEEDEELIKAVQGLSNVGFEDANTDVNSARPSSYSTTVIRAHPHHPQTSTPVPSLSSILTIRPSLDPSSPVPVVPAEPAFPRSPPPTRPIPSPPPSTIPSVTASALHSEPVDPLGTSSLLSIASLDSYRTASPLTPSSSSFSSALATEGGSTLHSVYDAVHDSPYHAQANFVAPQVHRFTLHKPGAKPRLRSGSPSPSSPSSSPSTDLSVAAIAWNPLLLFSSGLLSAKCDLCSKRLGWKPVLECDDCGVRCHVNCGENAPRNCGVRVGGVYAGVNSQPDIHAMSPLSRVKQSISSGAIVTEVLRA